MNPEDDRFADELGRALRDSEALDPVSRARLAGVRARALDHGTSRRWAWLGAAGAIAAVLAMALWTPRVDHLPQTDGPDAELLEMLAGEAGALDPALVEDLDLLTWMDEQGESA